MFRGYVVGELAHAQALAGNTEAAAAALGEADRMRSPAEALLQPWVELARPWVAASTGDTGEGVRLAIDAARFARDQDAPGFEAFALHDAARLGAADLVADRLQELASTNKAEFVEAMAGHVAAILAADAESLETAGTRFTSLGADLLAAEAYVQAAKAYPRAGSPANARRARARAALLVADCEGASTPILAGITAPRLTPRERDIAQLAATGLSNQDIADRLVISARTVGNHLYRIYPKLGITGRSGLVSDGS
jgi:DNA-binding CsgD family transcriptional regulator